MSLEINMLLTFGIIIDGGEKESRKREKLSKGRMLLPARRQILGRDLRIQILALVRARETDCRIRRKPGVPKGERVFSVFFLPIPLAFATSWPPSIGVPRGFRP